MSREIQVPNLPSIDGEEVGEFGRIRALSGGVPVYALPGSSSGVLANLRFNDRVFVILRLRTPSGWLMVSTDDGAVGYVAQTQISVGAPDPNARLHYVRPGETAQVIARQYYSEGVERGRDERFYVNVLVHANWTDTGERTGVYREQLDGAWDTTQTRENYLIWVPSVEFANTLEGQVSAGSFRRDVWNRVARTFAQAWDWVKFSAGFLGGLIHGALECVWDMVVGIFDLVGFVWDFIKVLIAGELLSQARALWDSLSLTGIQRAATGLFNDFVAKWNHESALRRGHFRGWVVGYLIATVLLTIFTLGGAALALTGRLGVIIQWARSVRVLSRAMDAAVTATRGLNAAGNRARDALRNSFRRTRTEPSRSPAHQDLSDELRAANGSDTPQTGAAAVADNATSRPTRRRPGSRARGNPEHVDRRATADKQLKVGRQNDSADYLAEEGFEIRHNQDPLPNGKEPDYFMEGNYWDHLNPTSNNADQIRKGIRKKADPDPQKRQADRVVVRLDDSSVTTDELINLLQRRPISELQEAIIIENGSFTMFVPR